MRIPSEHNVDPVRLRELRDRTLRYIFDRGAGNIYWEVYVVSLQSDLGFSEQELGAVYGLLHRSGASKLTRYNRLYQTQSGWATRGSLSGGFLSSRTGGLPSDCLGFGFAFSTALAIVSLGRLLTYVRADTAQKEQSAAEDETAPPFEVYRNRSSFSLPLRGRGPNLARG
jgi:hypothetical protein